MSLNGNVYHPEGGKERENEGGGATEGGQQCQSLPDTGRLGGRGMVPGQNI